MNIKHFKKPVAAALILIFSIMNINSLQAQTTKIVNAKEAVQIALENNGSLKAAEYSLQAAKAMQGASWDLGKTSLGMEYGQMNSQKKDNSFNISQSFSFPTIYANQHKLAQSQVRGSEWEQKRAQLEIANQVKQTYWLLAYAYSKHKLLRYQDSLYSGFMRAADLRAKSGETNKLEMITARSQSMEVKNNLMQVVSDINMLKRKLITLLNSQNTVDISDTTLKRLIMPLIAENIVVSQNPLLGYTLQQAEISMYEKNLEKSKLLPDLNIGYFNQSIIGTQEVNGAEKVFGPRNRFSGIQAGISIPLFFGSNNAKIKAATLNEQATLANADYMAVSLKAQYNTLIEECAKHATSLDYYEQQALPEAELIINQSTRSYRAGDLDYLDYVISLGRALEIKQNYLETLNRYNQEVIETEYVAGVLGN